MKLTNFLILKSENVHDFCIKGQCVLSTNKWPRCIKWHIYHAPLRVLCSHTIPMDLTNFSSIIHNSCIRNAQQSRKSCTSRKIAVTAVHRASSMDPIKIHELGIDCVAGVRLNLIGERGPGVRCRRAAPRRKDEESSRPRPADRWKSSKMSPEFNLTANTYAQLSSSTAGQGGSRGERFI